ncbi:Uncharacterized membrane protein [Williamsia sterculiae]|uniref:Uncharacterized membrane protein n=1 Tax=Williamsia sterculiae TaxID=1344003 RepID=A0A1N7E0N8_9NOCA|nr:Uncharacterized membrane protein [Williamsia sterculiae]
MSPERTSSTAGRRLDTPRQRRGLRLNVNTDAIGVYSERIARFLGTGRYLAIQTVIVVVWIGLNLAAVSIRWDPYPFILLNLAFSTQAAYAAPLILLAQNRQENRDRVALEEDRLRAEQTKADTEFLARELAAVRLAVGDTVTRDYLRKELDDLLGELTKRLDTDDGDPHPESRDDPRHRSESKKGTKNKADAKKAAKQNGSSGAGSPDGTEVRDLDRHDAR